MEKITSTLRRISEAKLLVSVILILLCSVSSVCFYGFIIGGSQYQISYWVYILFSSLVVSFLLCLFMLGKIFLKRIFSKEYRDRQVCGIVALILLILQFLLYSPLNKLSASETNALEYETEIVYVDSFNRSMVEEIFFMDSDGNETSMSYISQPIYTDSELVPLTGGKMIVYENIGGFGLRYFELIEVTFEPE